MIVSFNVNFQHVRMIISSNLGEEYVSTIRLISFSAHLSRSSSHTLRVVPQHITTISACWCVSSPLVQALALVESVPLPVLGMSMSSSLCSWSRNNVSEKPRPGPLRALSSGTKMLRSSLATPTSRSDATNPPH